MIYPYSILYTTALDEMLTVGQIGKHVVYDPSNDQPGFAPPRTAK